MTLAALVWTPCGDRPGCCLQDPLPHGSKDNCCYNRYVLCVCTCVCVCVYFSIIISLAKDSRVSEQRNQGWDGKSRVCQASVQLHCCLGLCVGCCRGVGTETTSVSHVIFYKVDRITFWFQLYHERAEGGHFAVTFSTNRQTE